MHVFLTLKCNEYMQKKRNKKTKKKTVTTAHGQNKTLNMSRNTDGSVLSKYTFMLVILLTTNMVKQEFFVLITHSRL